MGRISDRKKWDNLSFNERQKNPPYTINGIESWSSERQDIYVLSVLKSKRNGYFIELGAADGIRKSNTKTLEKNYNWNGICIEADKKDYDKCCITRNCIIVNECVDQKNDNEVNFLIHDIVSGGIIDNDCDYNNKNVWWNNNNITTMKTKTLEFILDLHNSPKIIDYLALDVEGAEYRILKNFPFDKYKILILTIERPSDILIDLLKNNGYIINKKLGQDIGFIHKSIL